MPSALTGNIDKKGYKALASAGITSINEVRNADADRLQIILSRYVHQRGLCSFGTDREA